MSTAKMMKKCITELLRSQCKRQRPTKSLFFDDANVAEERRKKSQVKISNKQSQRVLIIIIIVVIVVVIVTAVAVAVVYIRSLRLSPSVVAFLFAFSSSCIIMHSAIEKAG